MEQSKRIAVSYRGNTIEQFDLALGVSARKKAILGGKKNAVTSYSKIIQRAARIACMFLLIGLSLAALLRRSFSPVLAAAALFCTIYSLICFISAVYLRRILRRQFAAFETNVKDGTLFFDANGIEDKSGDGKSTCCDWEDYDMCVVTDHTIVLLLGAMVFFTPYSPGMKKDIELALAQFGKADTVIDCRNA